MSIPSPRAKGFYSRFDGVEERSSYCDDTHALEAFNVEFRDGTASRRKGRQKLFETIIVRPTKVLFYDGTNVTDVTLDATDGIFGTSFLTSPWNTANARLYVGSPIRTGGTTFILTSPGLSSNTTLTVQFWAGGTGLGSWVAPSAITDGTAIGGFTMKGSGLVSWSYTEWTGVPWSLGAKNSGVAAIDPLLDQDLYWVRFSVGATGTGAHLAEVRNSLTDRNGINLQTESSGMIEFTARGGDRVLVSVNEFPGLFQDAVVSAPTEKRLFTYDLHRGDVVPLRLPQDMRYGGMPGRRTSFVVFNGWLLGALSDGSIWKYNGKVSDALESMPGLDAQRGVIGSQGYSTTPRGTLLEVYRNRLAVTGDPAAPMTFQLSIEDNNISMIPGSATVGGPNVWPLRYIFNVPGREGDRIVAASVINDRYCLLTRSQLWVFDDSSLRLANGDVGCVAAGSVQRVDNTIFFLSDLGVYVFDSVDATLISAPLWETLQKRVNWRAIEYCTSAHDKKNGEYWLWLPINGEFKNQIAIVYSYIHKSWRVVGGWYPFDTNTRRDANSVVMSVTASCQARGADGKQSLITCDTAGTIWEENVGYDDNGKIYPAYMMLKPQGDDDYKSSREWYISPELDGQWFECYQLGDGDRFDQELDRRFANDTTNSQVVQKRALVQNAVSANATQQTFSNPPWQAVPSFAQAKKIKFSFGRNITKMQPVIHWTPGGWTAGAYSDTPTPAPGKLRDVQIGESPKAGGR